MALLTLRICSVLLALETPAEQVEEEDHPYLSAGFVDRGFLRETSPLLFSKSLSDQSFCISATSTFLLFSFCSCLHSYLNVLRFGVEPTLQAAAGLLVGTCAHCTNVYVRVRRCAKRTAHLIL